MAARSRTRLRGFKPSRHRQLILTQPVLFKVLYFFFPRPLSTQINTGLKVSHGRLGLTSQAKTSKELKLIQQVVHRRKSFLTSPLTPCGKHTELPSHTNFISGCNGTRSNCYVLTRRRRCCIPKCLVQMAD